METKGIELTECNNCRFRAVVDGKEVTRRIEKSKTSFLLTGDDWFGCAVTPAELDNLLRGADLTVEDESTYISGFEIVPRDPETYKDWQVGDIIWDSHESGDNGRIIFRSGDFVAVDINGCLCYTCEELFDDGYRLILTDIEEQIIEEKKKAEWNPQDGDICFLKTNSSDEWIFIKSDEENISSTYACLLWRNNHLDMVSKYVTRRDLIKELRPATEEEKQRLFDALAKAGKRWNAEKKCVEDIPKLYEFKKGEPVLVRADEFHRWIIAAYTSKDELGFIANAGVSVIHWKYCIPYNERTMHLLGTTEDYKEE